MSKLGLKSRLWIAFFVLVILGVIAGGFWGIENNVRVADSELRQEMLHQIVAIARTIDPELVKSLTFTAADSTKAEFQILRQQMIAYEAVAGYRGIYTLARRAGELRFGPESYAEDDPQASPPGTAYQEFTEADLLIFTTGEPIVEGPNTDEYGSFVSALAPVRDVQSGEVLMVVGIDLETDDWDSHLNQARLDAFLPIFILATLVVVGVLLMWWRDQLPTEPRARLRYMDALLIGIFGLVITVLLAQIIDRSERQARKEVFQQLAESRARLVLNAFLNIQDHRLEPLSRLFKASEFVTRQEFDEFSAPLLKQSAIQAMAWAPSIPFAQKTEWEVLAQQEGLGDYYIWELKNGRKSRVSQRELYFPVWYLEPVEENKEELGFDLGSETVLRTALEEAVENGLPTATEPILFTGDQSNGSNLAVFTPVFREKEKILQGIAVVYIQLDPILHSVSTFNAVGASSSLGELYQLESDQEPIYLASSSLSPSQTSSEQGSAEFSNTGDQELQAVFPIFAFSRAYALAVQADDTFLSFYPLTLRDTTLSLGLLISALVTSFAFYLTNRWDKLQGQVRVRTVELETSRADLLLAYDATIEGWSHALELRDEDTQGHTRRVTQLTERLARALGVGGEELRHIKRGALLHDIGKIGVADKILRKRGKLTQKEMQAVRQHPQLAYDMLSSIDYLRPALVIPYSHHEKWDGTGYPRGLKGTQIPLVARIFAVVDVYDALTSDRPYRKAWPKEKALKYIREQSGKHFDPIVVNKFMEEFDGEHEDTDRANRL